MSRTAPKVPRAVPAIFERPARGRYRVSRTAIRRAEQVGLHEHLRGERVGALLQTQPLEEVEAHGAERPVVGEAQAEEQAQRESQPVVAEALV